MYNWRWMNDDFPELANVHGALKFMIVERVRKQLRATPFELPQWVHWLRQLAVAALLLFLLYHMLSPPDWLVFVLPLIFGVPGALWFWRFHAHLDRYLAKELVAAGVRPELCVYCRYDLKGCLPYAEACPECGNAIAPLVEDEANIEQLEVKPQRTQKAQS